MLAVVGKQPPKLATRGEVRALKRYEDALDALVCGWVAMQFAQGSAIAYMKKMINGQRFVVSTGFADRKSAERRASEIEHDIRAGIHGWKSTIPSFAEWWSIYKKTYTPMKSARNRDANIVAHFLPHFGARPLDEITKSDIVRYLNFRKAQ